MIQKAENKIHWAVKILKKNLKETLFVTIFSVIFILAIIIGNQFFGWNFQWQEIDPIDTPPIWVPYLLSAITFVTIGKFLFETHFYKILYLFIVKICRFPYRKYEQAKEIIWYSLIFIMAFVVIPWVIDVLNSILSFFFNIFQFLISIWHFAGISLGITLIIVLGYFYISKKESLVIEK